MAWAASTIGEPSSWRLMTVSRVTGMRPLAIRSRRTEPGPTLASWSLSPTKISRVCGPTERNSQASSGRSTIEASSTMTASAGRYSSTSGPRDFDFVCSRCRSRLNNWRWNGVGVAQGGFGQALGGLAGGREQDVGHPTLVEELDQDPHAGGLAHAWPAADDRHLAGERRRDGTPLVGLQNNLVSGLGLGHGRLELV